MKFIFFDTETTGLPKNWKAPMQEIDNWPRVIQLAWMVCDEEGIVLRKHSFLIKPEGWEMPTGDFWKDHGYTQQVNMVLGIPIRNALDIFISDLSECDALVSHNMDFDYNVVGAEMLRAKSEKLGKVITKICTKTTSTNYCKLPGNYGNYKWPKLDELHRFLFNKHFENAHDALADVIACKDCFFELIKRSVITIKSPINY